MAYGVRIQGVPREHGKPVWTVDAATWFTPTRLLKDPRFREIQCISGYVDFVAVLSIEEAKALHDEAKAGTDALLYDARDAKRVDRYLAGNRSRTRFVMITVYEWESGLG